MTIRSITPVSAHEGDNGVIGAEFAAVGGREHGSELMGARSERRGEGDVRVADGHRSRTERPTIDAQDGRHRRDGDARSRAVGLGRAGDVGPVAGEQGGARRRAGRRDVVVGELR